jgi:hypothetical protein
MSQVVPDVVRLSRFRSYDLRVIGVFIFLNLLLLNPPLR